MSADMSVALNSVPKGFDPSERGTPESRWVASLAAKSLLTAPPTDIVVVSPHPDDEVLGAGGLMHTAARAGSKIIVVSVTAGEAAFPDWSDLAMIRRRELSDALMTLAPSKAQVLHLDIPDGRVHEYQARLSDAVDSLISAETLLVSPYEHDGHPDHDATGEVCREIARSRSIVLWRYPIWTWHHSTPEQFESESWGRLALDVSAMQAKARALRCFRSQTHPFGRAPIVPQHLLEYFSRPYEAFLT